jgi:hypothetical protein
VSGCGVAWEMRWEAGRGVGGGGGGGGGAAGVGGEGGGGAVRGLGAVPFRSSAGPEVGLVMRTGRQGGGGGGGGGARRCAGRSGGCRQVFSRWPEWGPATGRPIGGVGGRGAGTACRSGRAAGSRSCVGRRPGRGASMAGVPSACAGVGLRGHAVLSRRGPAQRRARTVGGLRWGPRALRDGPEALDADDGDRGEMPVRYRCVGPWEAVGSRGGGWGSEQWGSGAV